MSIKKKYIKSRKTYKITFIIPKDIAKNHSAASLVGDFNNWNKDSHPMEFKKRDSTFSITVELLEGNDYQFRYLLDNEIWINESGADYHLPTPFGFAENSVLYL